MPHQVCIFVDWGTSNLRVWVVDSQGTTLQEHKSDKGLSKLSPDEFAPTLNALLSQQQVPEHLPILMCGMVGAASGWQEAPYLETPTKLQELASAAMQIKGQKRDIRIIPGIAQHKPEAPDVMRSEETLLLGLSLLDGQVLMPGTHSKWARIHNGSLEHFSTVMTGEVFALLKTHSILRHTISSDAWHQDAFLEAVATGFDRPEMIVKQLFNLRAGPLLFGKDSASAGLSKLSGWLIGAEIATSYKPQAGPLTLLSEGDLGLHYAAALDRLQIAYELSDAAKAVQAGLFACAKKIWPDIFTKDARGAL